MKKRVVGIVVSVFLVLLGTIGYLLVTRPSVRGGQEEKEWEVPLAVTETREEQLVQEALLPLYVDIKGAVIKPGMYQVTEYARLLDVVELAGGFTAEADTKQVNFSQLVHDQMLIFIPKVGEDIPDYSTMNQSISPSPPSGETDSAKVNINLASSEELQQLTGVGAKKAEAIISHREEHGSFKSVEELSKVSGFGEKTVEKLKADITI